MTRNPLRIFAKSGLVLAAIFLALPLTLAQSTQSDPVTTWEVFVVNAASPIAVSKGQERTLEANGVIVDYESLRACNDNGQSRDERIEACLQVLRVHAKEVGGNRIPYRADWGGVVDIDSPPPDPQCFPRSLWSAFANRRCVLGHVETCEEIMQEAADAGDGELVKAIGENSPCVDNGYCQNLFTEVSGKGAARGNAKTNGEPEQMVKGLEQIQAATSQQSQAQAAEQQETPESQQSQVEAAQQAAEQEAQQEQREHQQKIADLQSDIQELQGEIEQDNQTANDVGNNSCAGSGLATALCNMYVNLAAAKARQMAAKAQAKIQKDQEEIERLQNVPVQHIDVDTSYTGALNQQLQANPTPTIQETANQQVAQILAIGQANAAAQQQAAAQRAQQRGRQSQQTGASSGQTVRTGEVPQMGPSGAVQFIFRPLESAVAGNAVVTALGSGQRCPPDCSFTFARGQQANFLIQADSNSIFRLVQGPCATGGSSAPIVPGNSGGCSLVNAGLATTITVFVDPANSSSVGNNGSGGSGSSSGSNGSNGSNGGGAGTNVSGGTCADYSKYVTDSGHFNRTDGIVYGFLTNHSNQTLYVMTTFARGGKPDKIEGAAITLRPGQTNGGAGGGIWALGTGPYAVDTNPPYIYWHAVLESDVDQNKNCGSPW